MNHDDELQHKIEQGDFSSLPNDNIEVKAYQEVFKALDKSPAFNLPDDFAHKVVARLEAKQKRSSSFDYYLFGIGIVLLLASCIVAISLTAFQPDLGFLKKIGALKGVILFGVSFIILLNWIDHRFIRNKSTI